MPYSITPKGQQPPGQLCRRGHAIRWLGIPGWEFDDVVKAGLLPWKIVKEGGRRFYRTKDVKKVFLDEFRTSDISSDN